MARRPRVFVDGAIYHVYCRVGRGEPVFREPGEAKALLDVIREVKRRDELAILAWCVMSNHYHLALKTTRVPLWRSMRLVQGRFAKGYNRRHQVFGAVWQGRYKAILVSGERHLQQLIAYIHLNPVAAGVVKEPGHYELSGHREILGRGIENRLLDEWEALLPFGDQREKGVGAYLSVLQRVAHTRWAASGPEQLPWWKNRESEERVGERPVPRIDALGVSSEPEPPSLTAERFVLAAANVLDIGISLLAGPRSGRDITRVREMVAVLGVERYRIKVKDLARQLSRNPSAVSRWVSDAGRLRTTDDQFRERLEELAAAIRAHSRTEVTQVEGSEFVSGVDDAFVD